MAKRKSRNSKKQQEEVLVDLVEARESAQDFFERNQLYILGGLTVIVLIIGGLFVYNNLYKKPRQQESVNQYWKAEQQFFQDSFALALQNPGGGYSGFENLIDEYGSVPSANAGNYYAGISYLNLGDFDQAIEHLKKVKERGTVLPIVKNGALGDAYSEKGDFDKAMSYYKKAVKAEDNVALTPIYLLRIGLLNEKLGNADAARKAYEQLIEDYPSAGLVKEAEKYLARIE